MTAFAKMTKFIRLISRKKWSQKKYPIPSPGFQQGDLVLKVTNIPKKYIFWYDPKPWVVIDTLGSQTSIKQGKTILKRHKDNLKIFHTPPATTFPTYDLIYSSSDGQPPIVVIPPQPKPSRNHDITCYSLNSSSDESHTSHACATSSNSDENDELSCINYPISLE